LSDINAKFYLILDDQKLNVQQIGKSYSSKYQQNFNGFFKLMFCLPIKVILLADLIHEKKATARPKDVGDLVELEKIQRKLFSGK